MPATKMAPPIILPMVTGIRLLIKNLPHVSELKSAGTFPIDDQNSDEA
jgi:hypothetical protein